MQRGKKSPTNRRDEVGRASGNCLVQTPCSGGVSYSRLLRVLSNQSLNISKEGDFRTSLSNL